jgi:hypothetical protein
MEFGYFTLSDNRYPDNRAPEDFIRDITPMRCGPRRSGPLAWIGEHHFNL